MPLKEDHLYQPQETIELERTDPPATEQNQDEYLNDPAIPMQTDIETLDSQNTQSQSSKKKIIKT